MFSLITLVMMIILSSTPVYADSVYQRYQAGEKYYKAQDYNEALSRFLDAQVEAPDNFHLTYDIANAHYKIGNYEEAAKSYLCVVTTLPDGALEEQAYYNLGNCMYRQGKLGEAVNYYKKALEIDPDDQDAKHNLEFVREEIKRRLNKEQKRQRQQQQQQDQQQDQQQAQQGDQSNENNRAVDSKQNQENMRSAEQREEEDGWKQEVREQPAQKGEDPEQKTVQEQTYPAQARLMTQEEAERLLRSLSEDQKEVLKQQARKQLGEAPAPAKDW